MRGDDAYVLFNDALQVMNKAILENADRFPYGQIMKLGEKVLGGKEIGVAVYASDSSSPFDYFTVEFKNGKLELVSHGKEHPAITWKVSRDYLAKVAGDPEHYIERPERLDLDWVRSRLGLDT